ncbi:MAG TPA: hypothetical protein VH351_02425 [Bryobacteraceae bacterium]|jgi:hypothetical protein|nr:hypothetical protein [Bryobacteraceae bacterium]
MSHWINWFLPLGLAIFVSILFAMEIGRRSGIHVRKQDPEGATSGTGPVDGAIFGLMGLLIAFTFSGAASRFDARRQLIVDEANKVDTAYLRITLLPGHVQPILQEAFRQYVDARLAIYRKLPDLAAATAELNRANKLQQEIWAGAVAGCQEAGSPAVMTLVLGSMNEMINVANTRTEGSQMHPPLVIPVMLVVLVLACSLLAGNLMAASKMRNWVHILGFAIMLSVTVLIILDIEYPRIGAIRIDAWDRALIQVRANMR